MIVNSKVRNMDKKEKMKYLLEKLVDTNSKKTQSEVITQIGELAKDVKVNDFLGEFGLEGELDLKKNTITIKMENKEDLVISLNYPDRKEFVDPQPEAEKRPIKSFLTQDELNELKQNG